MRNKSLSKTVRRSVALPSQLVKEATSVAPSELRRNMNRLVTVALREYVAHHRERDFEEAMARMAADPAIRTECATIFREFAGAEADGLKDD